METTNETPSPQDEEGEFLHKSSVLRDACADFVAKGWKLISPDSLEVIHEYAYATFRRVLNPKPEDIFLKIYDDEVLDLMIVSSIFIKY
jgi:hypothetical protein